MRVLIACEFSGVVRRAFRERGHDAWSCDLLPAEDVSPFHLQGDVRQFLDGYIYPPGQNADGPFPEEVEPWDLLIAHPPCTHLAVSGARWFKDKRVEQEQALAFVRQLMEAGVPRICIENPISIISSRIRKPDQIVQPHNFGHPEFKATCLWLKGLPQLKPTNQLPIPERGSVEWKAWNRVHREPPGPDRWKARSRTMKGLGEAMADQWGDLDCACGWQPWQCTNPKCDAGANGRNATGGLL